MDSDYTATFQNAAAVNKYEDVTYASDSYATRINERQRVYLRALVRDAFPDRRPVHHDFACGTGRAVQALHGLVREAHGYDTSTAMLARARALDIRAHLHAIDAEGPVPEPASDGRPAVVTMFRLMLNVDDAVRHRALTFAARILKRAEDGLLVIENHGNAGSIRHLRSRHRAGHRWFAELSHGHVQRLLDEHGFEVVTRRGFTMFGQGWYRRRGLTALARGADAATVGLPGADRFAVNVVYVARRVPSTAGGRGPAGTAA